MISILSDCTLTEQPNYPECNWGRNGKGNKQPLRGPRSWGLVAGYGAHICFSFNCLCDSGKVMNGLADLVLPKSSQCTDSSFDSIEDPGAKPQQNKHKNDQQRYFR